MAAEKGIRKYGSVGGKSDGDLLKVLAEVRACDFVYFRLTLNHDLIDTFLLSFLIIS